MTEPAFFSTLAARQRTGQLWPDGKPGVVVMGAGSSGIAALVELQRLQLPALALESRAEIGGIWSQSPHPATYPHLLQNTAPELTVFAEQRANFVQSGSHLTRQQYANYLKHYTEHYQLTPQIYTGCTLLSIRQIQDGLELVVQDSTHPDQQLCIQASHLINASGLYHQPQWPQLPGLDSYTGTLWHSSEVDYQVLQQQQQQVLVLGAGNTAVDMVVLAHREGNQLSLSCRTPTWVLPRLIDSLPLDVLQQQLSRHYGKTEGSTQFRRRCLEAGAWYSAGEPAVTELDFAKARISVSTEVLPLLQQQVVTVYPGISHIAGRTVYFQDGRSMQPDCIICCTGYQYQSPELPAAAQTQQPLVAEVRHPTLAQYWCLGAPAVWGGSPPVAKAQARLAATAIAAGWSVAELARRAQDGPVYQRTKQLVGPGFAVVEYQGYLDFVAALCADSMSPGAALEGAACQVPPVNITRESYYV